MGIIMGALTEKVFDNAVDRVIDTTIDNTIDNVKSEALLKATQVWTCVNKEMHGDIIVNLMFVTKFNRQKRVPYNNVENFIKSEYVSNVTIENGQVKFIGININEIPTYKLNQNGQYTRIGLRDENYVYNKALAYIQSQEQLILEDYRNKCLKTDKSNGETKTNFTENLSNIKDISTATAVTAVTAASTAAVAGTVVAGKAIYTKLNKKKLMEEQSKICKSLINYRNLLKCLIQMKRNTNALYSSDVNMITYDNSIEASNDKTGTMKKDVLNMGVNGCINRALEGLRGYRSKANSLKILTLPLNKNGIEFGTLDAFISSLENSINTLKNLHMQTKALIDNNKQALIQEKQNKEMEEQLKLEQENLIRETTTRINDLENIIVNLEQFNINDLNEIELVENKIVSTDIENKIQDVNNKIQRINEQSSRNSFENTLRSLESKLSSIKNSINESKNKFEIQYRNQAEKLITNIEVGLNNLISNSSAEPYTLLNEINNNLSTIKNVVTKIINNQDLLDRVHITEEKLQKNINIINNNIKNIEKQSSELIKLESLINTTKMNIESTISSRSIQDGISRFINRANLSINNITNTDILNKAKQMIDNAKSEFEVIYNYKLLEEQSYENERQQKLSEVLQQIDTDINEINNHSLVIVTKDEINKFNSKLKSDYEYKALISNYTYDFKEMEPFRGKINQLNNLHKQKKRKYEDILNKENRAVRSLNNDIEYIRNNLTKLNKYNKINIESKINSLSTSLLRNDLQQSDWLDNIIKSLKSEYDNKVSELGL